MISEQGKKLVSDLMMNTGGDPVEWKQNYDNLINFIEQLEKSVIDAAITDTFSPVEEVECLQ